MESETRSAPAANAARNSWFAGWPGVRMSPTLRHQGLGAVAKPGLDRSLLARVVGVTRPTPAPLRSVCRSLVRTPQSWLPRARG